MEAIYLKKIRLISEIGILFSILIIGYVFFLFSPPLSKAKTERFVIKLNTPEEKVIKNLYSHGYIRSPSLFKLFLYLRGWKGKIKPGGYEISKGMWAFKIADILVNHPAQKWVLLYEGLRKEEIAERIGKQLGWEEYQKKEFLRNGKEGYLFPDTYLFDLDSSGKEIAEKMMAHFNEKTKDFLKEAKKKNISPHTLIIFASLVQREAAHEKEMPLIAGIIWNRWLKGMNLEIDATIQYALGKPGNWWPIISKEDYKIDSPYNTYIHRNTPPTPICNPGLTAIKSVIFPEKTEYLFYLHDQSHQIHLAKTYEEHLNNIKKYIIFPAIKLFVSEYLQTYKNTNGLDYHLLTPFLTLDQLEYLRKHPSLFQDNFVAFEDFEILKIKEEKENNERKRYLTEIKLYFQEKTLKKSSSRKIIKVVVIKENGKFKTPTWNLLQKR